MKTLVIGASGFVGPYLIEQLQREGWAAEATCLPQESINTSVPVHRLDIRDPHELEAAIDSIKPEAIIHLAAQSSVALSWKEPALTVEINIIGAVNLLEAVKKTNPSIRILLVGSGEQYGTAQNSQLPICENVPQEPKNIYSITKYTQELLGGLYADAFGMDIIRARSFNHIGPGQSPQFVVSDFCKQVATLEKSDGPYEIRVGNLAAQRDFTDVRDVVRAYVLLCEKGKKGEIYNVGSGSAIAISEILSIILSLSHKNVSVEVDPAKLRPLDLPKIEADISKLANDTGWRPGIDIHTTLLDTLNYWRQQLMSDTPR